MNASAMDWPTTVSEFHRVFDGKHSRRGESIRGVNFMTPETLGYVDVNGERVEITTGIGFNDDRIFGVTFPRVNGLPDERDHVAFSLEGIYDTLYGK